MMVQDPIQAAIWHCLNHYDYQDAIFLAERLCAEENNEDTAFLLATCYYRSGKPGQAYSILQSKGARSPQCRYLLSRCCLDLQILSEAEAVLVGGEAQRLRSLDEITTEFGDKACFVLQILSRICAQSERSARANDAARRALKLNPFLWHSFEALCDRGERLDPTKVFTMGQLESLTDCHGSESVNCNLQPPPAPPPLPPPPAPSLENISLSSTPIHVFNTLNAAPRQTLVETTPSLSSINSSGGSTRSKHAARIRSAFGPVSISPMTPSFGVLPLESPLVTNTSLGITPVDPSPPPPPSSLLTETNDQKSLAKRVRAHVGQLISRKDAHLQQGKPVFSQGGNTSPHTGLPGVNVRRSSRLFSNSYSVKENNKSPQRGGNGKFVTPKSPSRKPKAARISAAKAAGLAAANNERNARTGTGGGGGIMPTIGCLTTELTKTPTTQNQSSMVIAATTRHGVESLMVVMRNIGNAYLHFSQYDCRKAIDLLESLPENHKDTPWVHTLLGKAHFEIAEYSEACVYFNEAIKNQPYRTDAMEIYSTALWHLQREAALSTLAQELLTHVRHSAAAWCAAGNAFSLQKEHDAAIRFLQRAVQLEPDLAYAYTLLGHELVATEELDKAMNCFRSAVRIAPRHYNAWYGIGTIYAKQERFQLAELSFRRALKIHPQSSVLMCHVGVVQAALRRADLALRTFDGAVKKDPKNPLCKFHRASVLFAAGRYLEAARELEDLKGIVPTESLVYYLAGKVHKKLGNTHLALMHFSWATDLDPKGANSQIKEAIDPALGRSRSDDEPQVPEGASSGEAEPSSAVIEAPSAATSSVTDDSTDDSF